MKRITSRVLGPVALVVALALAASACNLQWSPYAAKVGAAVISPSQLDNALKSASSNSSFRCLLEKSSASGYRLQGAGQDTYDASFVAFVLTNLIDARVARSVVQSAGIAEPASARALAREQVVAAFQSELGQAQCPGTGTAVADGLGAELTGSFVQLQLDEDALAAHVAHVPLTTAGLTAYARAHPATARESCLSGIFVKTKTAAHEVEGLLRHGASFASLVPKFSVQQGAATSNGALGCYTNPQLVQVGAAVEKAVAAAAVGGITAPVSYQGTFLILLVTSRPFESPAQLLNQLFSQYATAFSTAISRGVRHTSVTVNAKYGRWVTGPKAVSTSAGFGGKVVPHKAPASDLLLNPSVVQGKAQTAPSLPLGTAGG